MTLQSVLQFVTFSQGSPAVFVSRIEGLLSFFYQNSQYMRDALEIRVLAGEALTFQYTPGAAVSNLNFDGPDLIEIDPAYCDTFKSINQFGQVHQRGFAYDLLHELCHVLFDGIDPDWVVDPSTNDFIYDFQGTAVRWENIIGGQLGWSDKRIGYFSMSDQYGTDDPSYTGGAEVDYGFKNIYGRTLIDASESMQKDLSGLLIGGALDETIVGGNGRDFLWGNGGGDKLSGGLGDDALFGGLGFDQLFGGGDDDFIFFDTDDTVVNGGTGRDSAWLVDDDARSFDITANEIEVLVGGGGNDTLTAGNSSETLMIAGGAGSDVFNVSYGNGEGTRILWGGDGADSFQFTFSGDENGPIVQLGILVANVAGLTAANFGTFTLSMLNLPASFVWGAINAVILNPGAGDQVYINGYTLDTDPYVEGYYADTGSGGASLVATYTNRPAISGLTDYLGPTLHIQSPEGDGMGHITYRRGEDGYASLFNGQEVSEEDLDDLLDELGTPYATWTIDTDQPEKGEVKGNAYYFAGDADGNFAPDEYDRWFIAGGKFADGSLESVNAPTATMDPDAGIPLEWLLA